VDKKDLCAFNLSMLAKEGWCVLTKSCRSLCVRVLKIKCYPDIDVLATPKDGTSHMWRSMMRVLELVKLGLIKRVRDG
jgi:hypothetical protein